MLTEEIDLLRFIEKLDPNSEDSMGHTGRARGYALSVGTLAVLCATAESEEERAQHATELCKARDNYIFSIGEARRTGSDLLGDRAMEHRNVVRNFAARVAEIPDDGRMSRAEAVELARISREEVLPAIYAIVVVFQGLEMDELRVGIDRLQEKAGMVDRLISEMERITRLINLISINASVEAARAGGVSGRAFRVIADEVRALASQSKGLLGETRTNLNATAQQARRPPPRRAAG
ncbi:MAG: methyl-accepting chemotaxis protein [Pseudomonadota bacterium]